jgi:MerR family transcriptional regulator, light-induced transcriptional regulator
MGTTRGVLEMHMPLERSPKDRAEQAYRRFLPLLDAEDKEGCVRFALAALENSELDVVTLYEDVLAPAAREPVCSIRQRALCIWEEHVRTSIVRTVVECCYPHLAKLCRETAGDRTRGQGVIVCPSEEYHELGARMAADMFAVCGFDVTFVGANTPQQDILEAVTTIAPVFIGVSVTGPYNLIAARRTIQQLGAVRSRTAARFRIVAGGQAFGHDIALAASLGADLVAQTFDDIRRISEEVPWSSR